MSIPAKSGKGDGHGAEGNQVETLCGRQPTVSIGVALE
jgi:hypothetical protein